MSNTTQGPNCIENADSGVKWSEIKDKSSNRYSHSIFQNTPGTEQIYLTINTSVVLCCAYIPPKSSRFVSVDQRFDNLLSTILDIKSNGFEHLVIGDFNARFGAMPMDIDPDNGLTIPVRNDDKKVNKYGKLFRHICSTTDSTILTGLKWCPSHTCFQKNGCSVVDTGICSSAVLSCIIKGKLHSLNCYSDHCMISFVLSLKSDVIFQPFSRPHSPYNSRLLADTIHYTGLLFRVADAFSSDTSFRMIANQIEQLAMSGTALSKQALSSLINDFYDVSNRVLLRFYRRPPYKWKDRPKSAWFNGTCCIAQRRYRICRRHYQRVRTKEALEKMLSCKKRLSRVLRYHQRCYEKKWLHDLFLCQNADQMWKHFGRKQQRRPKPNFLVSQDEYADYLSKIANGMFSADDHRISLATDVISDIESFSYDLDIVQELMESFENYFVIREKFRKSPGLDNWTGEVLKVLNTCIMDYPILEYIFILVFISGTTPKIWDHDVKVPILKAGKRGDHPSHLRPITLVNAIVKAYERWILEFLKEHISTAETQAGFKSRHSCVQWIFVLRTLVDQSISNNSEVYAVLIDFSSFFDTVRPDLLIKYLKRRDVPVSLLKPLYGMLNNLTAHVRMNGSNSRSFRIKVGVRQGSVLSPFLAALFLDQISDFLSVFPGCDINGKSVNHLFYADDLIVFDTDPDRLQFIINRLDTLCGSLGLSINYDKTMSTIFGKKISSRKEFSIKSNPITSVESVKYLGCTIDHRCDFKRHFSLMGDKADKSFYALLAQQTKHPTLKFSDFLNLYTKTVVPVLTYGCEVFAWDDCSKLEHAFVRHLVTYFRVPSNVNKSALYWTCGVTPITILVWNRGYDFWTKILGFGRSSLERSAFTSSKCLHQRGEKSWYSAMIGVFHKIGFSGDFDSWSAEDAREHRNSFRELVRDFFVNKMRNELLVPTSKYSFLIECFPTLYIRQFLDFAVYYNRFSFVKIFLSQHRLPIEVGRWYKIPREFRHCHYCISEPGNEVHYITTCKSLSVERDNLCKCFNCTPENLIDVLTGTFYLDISLAKRYNLLSKYLTLILKIDLRSDD